MALPPGAVDNSLISGLAVGTELTNFLFLCILRQGLTVYVVLAGLELTS